MAYLSSVLQTPLVRLPDGPRTPDHIPVTLATLTSARAGHIQRMYTLLVHLLSLPPSPRTSGQINRAWLALATCKEVHFATLWRVGAAVIERSREEGAGAEDEEEDRQDRAAQRAEWLKYSQDGKEDKVDKFHEYVLALVGAGKVEFALDELDSYLDNQPYHDSVALNTLYGYLAILLAQASVSTYARPPSSSSSSSSSSSDSDGDEQMRQKGPSAKRAKLELNTVDADYTTLLRSMEANSPAMLNRAIDRFQRATRLEERQAKEADLKSPPVGEAARWLKLIRKHSNKHSSRHASPPS